MVCSSYKKIQDDWKKLHYKYFWGDPLDFRFLAVSKFPKTYSKNTLDIGCSVGVVLNNVNSDSKVGIDIDFKSLKMGKKIFPKTEFIAASANNLPFQSKVFDRIVSIHTLDIYEINQDDLLKEINRITNDNSDVFFTGNWFQKKKKSSITNEEKISGRWIKKLEDYFSINAIGYKRPKMTGMAAIIKKIMLTKMPSFLERMFNHDQILFCSYKEISHPIPMEPYIVLGTKIKNT